MSISAMAWVFEQDVGSSAAKFLLLSLADHCDNEGVCFPSLELLCSKTNQDRKTVIANLDKLCEIGLLRETGDSRGNGVKVYQIIGVPVDRAANYVYMISNNATGEYYIGVRSATGDIQNDNYFGSGSWALKQSRSEITKTIIGVYNTRKEAELAEKFHINKHSENPLLRNKYLPKLALVPEVEPVPKTEPYQYQKRNPTSTKNGTLPVPKTEPITVTNLSTTQTNQNTDADFILPDWIPQETWDAFMDSRKKLKARDTGYAKKLIVTALDGFRAKGFDPIEIINTSIRSGWKDVYAPKKVNEPAIKNKTYHDLSKMNYALGVNDDNSF
jgi:Helix-turn-helix domain